MKAENLLKLDNLGVFNIPKFTIIECGELGEKVALLDKNKLYAVRSSCILEDGDAYSLAGQFKTFLNVKYDELIDKALDVFKSFGLYGGRVIIQEMVDADYSGVVFTSNPIGILNETVVVIGKGLGCNIVEDKVETSTYYYNNDDKIYYIEGEKCIDEDVLNNIIKCSNIIKNYFNKPMDIEFAIKDNRICILQARPITTLKNNNNEIILDNSNIVESYPGISLPLTQEFVKEIYYKVFKSLVLRLTKSKEIVENMDSQLMNMTDICNGRVYYRISNWYSVLNLLPLSKKIIPIWQEMLGVSNKELPYLEKVNIHVKFNVLTQFINLIITSPNKMKQLNIYFNSMINEYKSNIVESKNIDELLNTYDKIMSDLTSVWDITLVNDMYSFLFTAVSGKKGKERISNIKNIESMKPVEELNTLVKIYKVQKETDFFKGKFNTYIEKYGDRCLEELKLETKTYRTNPEILMNYIKNSDVINLDKHDNTNKKEGFFVKRAKVGIYNREVSRMNRSRIFGLAREIMIKIGENLVNQDYIENTTDVFYLYISELRDISNYKEFKHIITNRKQEIEDYKTIPNYSRLVFNDNIINKKIASNNININLDTTRLSGTASSLGKVTGEIVVIDKPEIGIDTRNKIIVTESTDPGWVFLIKKCLGIIAERGSMLSHTAIITRELKKPSVVNVKYATQILKTGDIVELDGYTGIIKKIKEYSDADTKQ